MEDKHLENLLLALGSEEIDLPKHLIQNTKEKLKHRNFLSILCISVFLNVISLIGLILIVYFKFNFEGIIILYILGSFITSLSLLPLVFLKEEFKPKFSAQQFSISNY